MYSWKIVMPKPLLLWLWIAVLVASCNDVQSQTELNPEGPPMVRQVFVEEKVPSGTTTVIRQGLAFGDHPDFTAEEDDRQVTQAVAFTDTAIRIVLDELILGNAIEELGCADGTFDRVVDTATPDDVALCSAKLNPELTGCTAVCATHQGILDEEPLGAPDGAPDSRQMIAYMPDVFAVQMTCDGVNIALNPIASFWNPAGNQQITAGPLGLRSLGPVLVLQFERGLRTSSTCGFTFNPAVVDKDGIQVCAPQGGDINNDCTPGDTSLIQFGTEPLVLEQSSPAPDATNVPIVTGATSDKEFTLIFNAGIDVASIVSGVSLIRDPAGANETIAFTPTVDDSSVNTVRLVVTGGLQAGSSYELRFTSQLTDLYGGPLPADSVISFMTAAAVAPPTLERNVPDASTSL